MKFQTHNQKSIDTHLTYLQGHIQATRAQLQAVFGAPLTVGLDESVTTYWSVEFDTGVATIYDWKMGTFPDDSVIVWNIGGRKIQDSWAVHDAFRERFDFKARAA